MSIIKVDYGNVSGGSTPLEWLTPKMSVSGATPTVTFDKNVRLVIVKLKVNTGYVATWDEDNGEYHDSDLGQTIITSVSGASVTFANPWGGSGYTADVYAYA